MRTPAREFRGFSLIELLTVVGLIVILLAVVGTALTGRGGDGTALLAGQNTLQSLVSATRAQAALHQTTARLLVYATPPPGGDADKYLRYLQIVREEPAGSGTWIAADTATLLPRGVFIVPPANITTTNGVSWNTSTANGPVSLFVARNAAVAPALTPSFGGAAGILAYHIEFTADGRATASFVAGTPPRLAVATAVASLTAPPAFNNASAVRGVVIRPSGAVSRVNDANSF
jgi:prepilin-type N-terminal cleavage/methylation domain-containing protein